MSLSPYDLKKPFSVFNGYDHSTAQDYQQASLKGHLLKNKISIVSAKCCLSVLKFKKYISKEVNFI